MSAVTTTPLEITLLGQKEAEVGIVQTAHALRRTEPCVFKGFKELFPYVPLREGGGMLFKQKLAAAVSAFSASDIIHLWVNSSFVPAMFALSPQRENTKTHEQDAEELARVYTLLSIKIPGCS